MFNLPFSKALAVCALNLAFCLVASSQGTTTRITGTVTDPQGSPVTGATVSIKREGQGVPLVTQTSDTGQYVFDLIQAGKYEVTVERVGFNKFVSTDNVAQINVPTTVNVTLTVGDVNATVTVVGAAEAVQTATSGNVSSTVDAKTVESLPIVGTRGRNPLDLLNFQPGVVTGGNTGGLVQVHGSRDRAFNFTLDGIDINESTFGGSNSTPVKPNPEAIQEFQIITSNPTAEQGRSSGAQVTFVTKSGTNEFHGNLFEFYQTPRFNAKSYAETIARSSKGQFVQHIFGGSFGGPIPDLGWGEGRKPGFLRDKAFFFVNLQMLRAYDTALVNRTVYTQEARNGFFRYVVGRANANAGGGANAAVDATGAALLPSCTVAPAPCIATYNANTQSPFTFDPTTTKYINEMPLPNNFFSGDGLNTARFSWLSPQRERQRDFVAKVDYILNQQNAFYVRFNHGNQNTFGDSVNGGRPIFPNTPRIVDTYRTPRNLAVNWRFSPTPRLTNEVTVGHARYGFIFDTPAADPAYNFVFLTISDSNLNDSYNARFVKTNQIIDNITFDFSPHTIKGGINFRLGRHRDDRYSVAGSTIEGKVSLNNSAALFNGSTAGVPSFGLPATGNTGINSTDQTTLRSYLANLVGFVNNVNRAFVSNGTSFDPPGTRWLSEAKYDEYDFYIQDNWKIRPNFLLDIGVRWEVKMNPEAVNRPILVPDQSVKLGAAPSNTLKWVAGELFDDQFGLILPSVGFAWDPFKSGKTSIRANYRMATDRFPTFLFGSSIFQGTPGNNASQSNTAFGQAGGLLRNVGPVIAGLVPAQSPAQLAQPPALSSNTLSVIDPDMTYPQVHSFLLSFQREMGKSNVFEFNYIRKHAVHLLGGYNINQANIFATDPRCPGQNFVQAWTTVMNNAAAPTPCLIGLFRNASGAAYTTTTFRSDFSADNAVQSTLGGATANSVAATARALAVLTGTRSLTSLGFSPFFFMQFPQFSGGFNVFDSSDFSNYSGLEFIFKRRFSTGLGFQVAYTRSISKDNRSFDPTQTTVSTGVVQSASSTPFNIFDRTLNYSWSDFDRRHVFQATWVWELPFGEGRRFKFDNSVLNYMISGWQFSGTFLMQSGNPFTVYTGFNTFSSVVGSLATCNGCTREMGKLILDGGGLNFWFDQATRAKFGTPAAGEISDIPRNFFIGPSYWQPDFSLLRKFRLTERFNLDFRVDARNAFNHPNFANPNAVVTNTTTAPFGRINDSVTNNARRVQFSMKLNF
jgi:hypothetical protein